MLSRTPRNTPHCAKVGLEEHLGQTQAMSSSSSSASNNENLLKIAYFASIAGVSILVGFSTTLSRLRKDPPGPLTLHDEGVALARKALGRATLYSVCGFSVFAFISYNLFGRELIERKALEYQAARERESDLPAEIKDYFVSDKQREARRRKDEEADRPASSSS